MGKEEIEVAEHYRFFDSIDDDDIRYYTADEFAEYFRRFIRNGVFNGSGDSLQVDAWSQDMRTHIKPGYSWIEGYLYKIDTEPLGLYHPTAHPNWNRLDRVVVRLDKRLEHRYVKAFVLTGTPAQEPQLPALTRSENVYEIALAQVEILAGKSFIEPYQITDERLNPEVCGVVTHLFEQVDTTAIFNEWVNYLTHKKAKGETLHDAYQAFIDQHKEDAVDNYEQFLGLLQDRFSQYQQVWADWRADHLAIPGGSFHEEWNRWLNDIQETTDLVTKTESIIDSIIYG